MASLPRASSLDASPGWITTNQTHRGKGTAALSAVISWCSLQSYRQAPSPPPSPARGEGASRVRWQVLRQAKAPASRHPDRARSDFNDHEYSVPLTDAINSAPVACYPKDDLADGCYTSLGARDRAGPAHPSFGAAFRAVTKKPARRML